MGSTAESHSSLSIGPFGLPKINQSHFSIFVDDKVGCFNVPIDEAVLVKLL